MNDPSQQNHLQARGHDEMTDGTPDATEQQLSETWNDQRQHRWNESALRSTAAAIVDVNVAHLVVAPDVFEESDGA